MATKIGINGFGRIGRSVFRVLLQRDDLEVVAVNDIGDWGALLHLLNYDSVMGRLPTKATRDGDDLVIGDRRVRILGERDVSKLPWKELGVNYAVEATGVFRKREQVFNHIEAGASRVVLTVPAKDDIDATVVIGVNEHILCSEHRIVSNASCTTNCLAPVAKVLHERFGILSGFMTTVHAYTAGQRLVDMPHKDLRRARAAAVNIIPTTTGAARAVGVVLPDLNGKLDGISMRVPVPDGSVVDLVANLQQSVSVETVNAAMKEAAEAELKGVLEYCEDPIVSQDIVGNPHSSVFDSLSTLVMGGTLLKIVSWYDNEWGYSNRVVDLLARFKKLD